MKLFLGIDGGQSSTRALIGDENGRVLGAGRGGPCNHVSGHIAEARFREAIGVALKQALTTAGLPENTSFAVACCGLSGGPADKEALVRDLLPAGKYVTTTDALIALSGAFAGEPGIIVIAGTGSIAWGRNANGQTARAGGWGYVFGDEGSAFDIVRQALRACLRHDEGWGTQTVLMNRLLRETGARDINSLLHLFYTPEYPRKKVASLAPLVFQAAEEGDAVAHGVVAQAAQALAMLVSAVRAQIFPTTAQVSYTGGVFQNPPLLAQFQTLVELNDDSCVIAPEYDPAHGALIEAYRAAGLSLLPDKAV